jgi:8-oxo-dGTP diphosphatase / 2-hydroxy-dATP diphosphatase
MGDEHDSDAAAAGAAAAAAPQPQPPHKQLTLVLLTAGGRVLLGRKKTGFGAGKWNGFGGKVEPGETLAAAAAREFLEETTVAATGLAHVGHLVFTFEGAPTEVLEVHVFTASGYAGGEPAETDEMAPSWFGVGDIPYGGMWADDAHWLPHALAGRRFAGRFHFVGHDVIARSELRVLEDDGERLPVSPRDVLVTGARQGPITA